MKSAKVSHPRQVFPQMDADRYEIWLLGRGYRPDTVRRALQTLGMYARWCGRRRVLDQDTIAAFLAERARTVRPHTLLNYWKDLRMACEFSFNGSSPMKAIPRPKVSVHYREHDAPEYTESDFRSFLGACLRGSWIGLRDEAILWMLWTTPLRASELMNLERKNLDFRRHEIKVKDGKGGVKYEVDIERPAALAIRRYLEECPWKRDFLWVQQDGDKMTRESLRLMLARVKRRAEFDDQLSAHNFRHNWRMKLMRLRVSDFDISASMGHTSVTTTHGYGRKIARQTARERIRAARGGL